MESFAIIGLIGGIYSALVTAIYLPLRKENTTGLKAVWEQLKWFIWLGTAIFAPIVAMQVIDERFQLFLDKTERTYALAIWLGILWTYIGFVVYSSWKKGELKLYGKGGKVIYEGRKRKKIR